MSKSKSKKQFVTIGTYVLYILDNRDGHIKEAERDVLVLDCSYIDLNELPKMSERQLFMNSPEERKLMSADEVW